MTAVIVIKLLISMAIICALFGAIGLIGDGQNKNADYVIDDALRETPQLWREDTGADLRPDPTHGRTGAASEEWDQ